jgi:hypothetical protein
MIDLSCSAFALHEDTMRLSLRLQVSARGVATGVVTVVLLLISARPALERSRAHRLARSRLQRVSSLVTPNAGDLDQVLLIAGARDSFLASWQSVGGCGAGSATGIGGIKWIGRNVSGGLFHVQTQGNYTRLPHGYGFALQNQVDRDLTPQWNLGIAVPYLYKYVTDFAGLSHYDLSNSGVGDMNLLVTRRFGAIRDTSLTLSVGAPTGTHAANCQRMGPLLVNCLPQDRQLGSGQVSGGIQLEHTVDNIWGPIVYGGSFVYPGGENDVQNYRAPNGSLYAYGGYLLGPIVPAFGLTLTVFTGHDRDINFPSDRAMVLAGANGSLEWSNDWLAVLAGVSLPFSTGGLQPWTVGLGVAFAPF